MAESAEIWEFAHRQVKAQRDELLRDNVSLRARIDQLNSENATLRKAAGQPLSPVVLAQFRSRRIG